MPRPQQGPRRAAAPTRDGGRADLHGRLTDSLILFSFLVGEGDSWGGERKPSSLLRGKKMTPGKVMCFAKGTRLVGNGFSPGLFGVNRKGMVLDLARPQVHMLPQCPL